ncbi:CASP-like protein 1F1 [Tasmannia lanceolata]|uniref:CASP-like protein 1F1 n=1 Tax=Tasmannia lanceolata TaxID=3420 RepID=UPI00406324D7
METHQAKLDQNPPQKTNRTFVLSQVGLRILAFGVTLAATLLMATNKQTISLFGFEVVAKFSYSPTFRFFVGGNAVACAYSLFSLPFVFILSSQGSGPGSYFYMFLLDLVIMGLVMASAASTTAIAYVGRNGNSHIGWTAICDHFGKFCDKSGGALLCCYVAFTLFFLLTVLSASKQRQMQVSAY